LSFEVSDSDAASISEEVFNIDMPKAKNAEDLNCKLSVSDDLDLSTRPINESDFEISSNTSIKRSNKNRLGKSASQEDLREIEASADDFKIIVLDFLCALGRSSKKWKHLHHQANSSPRILQITTAAKPRQKWQCSLWLSEVRRATLYYQRRL